VRCRLGSRGWRRANGFGGEDVRSLLGGPGRGGDVFLPDEGARKIDGWSVGEEDGGGELDRQHPSVTFPRASLMSEQGRQRTVVVPSNVTRPSYPATAK